MKAILFVSGILLVFLVGRVPATNCRDGWLAFRGSCYYFARHMSVNFVQAENYCRQHNAHLIHVTSALENTFIKDYMTGLISESHWLGLTDELIEGYWSWYDNDDELTYSDWAANQPDNHRGVEDCAIFHLSYGFKWADVGCTVHAEPVCEYRDPDYYVPGLANMTIVG